jgi:hypothetical protein
MKKYQQFSFAWMLVCALAFSCTRHDDDKKQANQVQVSEYVTITLSLHKVAIEDKEFDKVTEKEKYMEFITIEIKKRTAAGIAPLCRLRVQEGVKRNEIADFETFLANRGVVGVSYVVIR